MVRVAGLTFAYPKATRKALDALSLSIRQGEIFGLVGPNGAGKTTLLRILAGLILPARGTVEVDGQDIVAHSDARRRLIGFSSGEERAFYYRLTGYQNLEFFGGLGGIPRRHLRSRIRDVARTLELEPFLNLRYGKYSLGEMKRLNLARALLTDAKLYLLDEPNNGIDPASTVRIRELIRSLAAAGGTVLMTTHNLEEVERLCDRVGILKQGTLIACDTVASLRSEFKRPRYEIVLGDGCPAAAREAFLSALRLSGDIVPVSATNGSILVEFTNGQSLTHLVSHIAESHLRVAALRDQPTRLEEIVIDMTESA
jgi:ABC-2 type transport system ATP-binding protein